MSDQPGRVHRWSSPEDDPDEPGAWCVRPGCFAYWLDEDAEPQTCCPESLSSSRDTPERPLDSA